MIYIIQDGKQFYDDYTGIVIFESTIDVKDYDIQAADKARQEFCEYAERRQLKYKFGGC